MAELPYVITRKSGKPRARKNAPRSKSVTQYFTLVSVFAGTKALAYEYIGGPKRVLARVQSLFDISEHLAESIDSWAKLAKPGEQFMGTDRDGRGFYLVHQERR